MQGAAPDRFVLCNLIEQVDVFAVLLSGGIYQDTDLGFTHQAGIMLVGFEQLGELGLGDGAGDVELHLFHFQGTGQDGDLAGLACRGVMMVIGFELLFILLYAQARVVAYVLLPDKQGFAHFLENTLTETGEATT